jgi:long-chain acyl-CoA synthetase
MLNVTSFLSDSAVKYANKPAFTFMDNTLTFAQVNGAACQVANGLIAQGIQKGDKVALSCLNLPYFPIIYFGILKMGAIVVPLSVLLKEEEILFHIENSHAKAYFCFEGTADLPMGEMGYSAFNKVSRCEYFINIMGLPTAASPFENVQTLGSLMQGMSAKFDTLSTSAEDTAIIVYTSGTTGQPKGAELTHSNLVMNAMVCQEFIRIRSDDTQLVVLPLFHIFAMTVQMNMGIYKGTHSILLPRFDANDAYKLMVKHKVTVFAGVPTMYWGMINGMDESCEATKITENLRLAVSGGAALPLVVLNDFKDKFDLKILEGYGMSEGSPVVTFNQPDVGFKAGSIGTPIWGVQVKLIDDEGNEVAQGEKGELLYKGHNVMKGYYNRPEANAATITDGWLHSGDIAIKDEDGFYFIVDRSKDMIIRGGLNVYPRQIEEVMIQHEAVSLVAVIGKPNDKMGEEIKAFVVLNKDMSVSADDLKAWTKERIASYKYPREIVFLEALPMSATGKILKKELRD